MSEQTFKDSALDLLRAVRPFQQAVERERCQPRRVSQSEEVQVSAATVGRREHTVSYPPDLLKLWSDPKKGLVVFR